MFATLSVGSAALAHGLRGFRSSTLRVRIERMEGGNVWIRTADLLDAGTPLVLDASQVEAEPEPDRGVRHAAGLVVFA